jgi:hypothetical protein
VDFFFKDTIELLRNLPERQHRELWQKLFSPACRRDNGSSRTALRAADAGQQEEPVQRAALHHPFFTDPSRRLPGNLSLAATRVQDGEQYSGGPHRVRGSDHRTGGVHNKKARTITEIASELKETYGRVTLAPLKEMGTEEAEKFLTSLPGVSKDRQVCADVCLRPARFPVDVHCRRVAHRLGWTPSDIYLTKRQADELQEGIPEPLRRDLHVGMVLLGGNYCLSKSPRCSKCPLLEFCPTGLELF